MRGLIWARHCFSSGFFQVRYWMEMIGLWVYYRMPFLAQRDVCGCKQHHPVTDLISVFKTLGSQDV